MPLTSDDGHELDALRYSMANLQIDQWGDLLSINDVVRGYRTCIGWRRWGPQGTLISPGEWEFRHSIQIKGNKPAQEKG